MVNPTIEKFYIKKKDNFISYLKLITADASKDQQEARDDALRDAAYMTYPDMLYQGLKLRALIACGSLDVYIDELMDKYGVVKPLAPEVREKIGRYIELFSMCE